MKILCFAQLKSSHHCFIDISKSLHHVLFQNQDSCGQHNNVLIECGNAKIVTSWSGYFNNDDLDSVSFDRKFATCNEIADGAELQISLIDSQIYPASSVTIQPLQKENYEILELNETLVERRLLDQISLVTSDLIFPFYLSLSKPILVKVVSTSPSSIVYLQPYTEVHILPGSATVSHKTSESKILSSSDETDTSLSQIFSDFVSGLGDSFLLSKPNFRNNRISPKVRERNEKDTHVKREILIYSLPELTTNINVDCDSKCISTTLPPYQALLCEKTEDTCLNNKSNVYAEIIVPNATLKEGKETNANENDWIKIAIQLKVLPKYVWTQFFQNTEVMFVTPILLEQLQAVNGTSVKLQCYHNDVEKPQGIVLHTQTSFSKVTFISYIEACLANTKKVILNQGTLLKFGTKETTQKVVVELIGILNAVCGVIDDETLHKIFVTVEEDEESENVCEDKKKTEKRLTEKNDGEVHSERFSRVICDLKTSFSKLSSISLNHPSLLYRPHCNFLIYGASKAMSAGCGKTSFVKAVADYFSQLPYCYHTKIINCVELRGKKIETIREHLNQIYEKCYQFEPALIIFDDLDEIIPNVDIVQDGIAMNLYSERLCEIFQNYTLQILNEKRQINTLVTIACKDTVHRNLLPETNTHLFTNYVSLSAPPSNQMAIVESCLINNRDCEIGKDHNTDLENLSVLKKKLEGFTPKDIRTIIQRTVNRKIAESVHRHTIAEADSSNRLLEYSDINETLEEYQSPIAHGANLHKPKKLLWDDIGGLKKVKTLLKEYLLWPALYPELLSQCPIKLSSGILLYGAPGTAKTMLASAVAYESQMNFISVKGPELLSKYVGSSETNVRDLFARGQAAKPCIIFFDELDSFAPRRGHDNTGVTDRVVNQLLTQLDGIESLDGVFVLAATSRPDLIDPALLRPGRLDKSILCEMPTEEERKEILTILTKDIPLKKNVDLNYLAELTINYSGADLKALVFNAQVENAHKVMKNIRISQDLSLCMEDFMKCVHETKPSVSAKEREKFLHIFEDFQFSKTTKSQLSSQLQRVTLA